MRQSYCGDAIAQWSSIAKEYDISSENIKKIQSSYNNIK
jgi:hypothetical protein